MAMAAAAQQSTQQTAAQQQAAVFAMNRAYMKNTVRHKSICPPSSGAGFNQTFAPAAQLSFSAPSANNAFMEGIYVNITLHVDLAAGTAATYAATAARELALIKTIQILYNGNQWTVAPYILPTLHQLAGNLQATWPNTVVAGTSNSYMSAYLTQGALPTTAGSTNNLVNIQYYIPLNFLHPQDVRGILPIDGNSTTAQINVTCAPALLGNDASQNCWYSPSGTGAAVTLTSGAVQTIQLIAAYRDGATMTSTSSLPVTLAGQGTVQVQPDVTLTGITAGQIYRQKIITTAQHYYVLHVIIDGQQANAYALNSNISYLELATDSTGGNTFWRYGTGTNLDVREYFNDIRYMIGQDLPNGMFPTVYAPVYNEADESNLNGSHVLNAVPNNGGWSDIHYGLSLASLAATLPGVTPRVETYVVYVNPDGLVAA